MQKSPISYPPALFEDPEDLLEHLRPLRCRWIDDTEVVVWDLLQLYVIIAGIARRPTVVLAHLQRHDRIVVCMNERLLQAKRQERARRCLGIALGDLRRSAPH